MLLLYTLRGSVRWPKGNPQWYDPTVYVSNVCGYYHNIPHGIPLTHTLFITSYWQCTYNVACSVLLWSTTVQGNTYQGCRFHFGNWELVQEWGTILLLCCIPTLENQIWRQCLFQLALSAYMLWVRLEEEPGCMLLYEELKGRIPGLPHFLFFSLYWQ